MISNYQIQMPELTMNYLRMATNYFLYFFSFVEYGGEYEKNRLKIHIFIFISIPSQRTVTNTQSQLQIIIDKIKL